MIDPLDELARCFRDQVPVTGAELTRLASAARAAGHPWAAMANAYQPGAEVAEPSGVPGSGSAGFLFRQVFDASRKTWGVAPSWPCADCGRQVTDLAPLGRPVHTEAGHDAECTRIARDQAADDAERQARLPALIRSSEPARGPLQRHRLAGRFIDDCPRCGWRGYFDTAAATLGGDWTRLLCDNCYADLVPEITVSVTYYACDFPIAGRDDPFGVIRQRARSDHEYPDLGQIITWDLRWQWTPILVQEARDGADCDVTRISRDKAEELITSLARKYWPPEALRLPWTASAYPEEHDPAVSQKT
jgi:hypothetical protein